MYFQWGRKDPLTEATGFTSSPFIVNGGISLTYAAQHPMVMGNNRNFAGALATWPGGKPSGAICMTGIAIHPQVVLM